MKVTKKQILEELKEVLRSYKRTHSLMESKEDKINDNIFIDGFREAINIIKDIK